MAAYDRREAILVRLLEIAQTIPGIVTAARNQSDLGERARPSIIIHDADEQVADPPRYPDPTGRSPLLVTMTPDLILTLGDTPANVGTQINALRVAFLAAVLTDSTLAGLVGTNGKIRYQGCSTGLARGRNMEASMAVSVAFTYRLFTAELSG